MDHTAIEKLIHTGEELHSLRFKALNDHTKDLIALPKDVVIHDLEKFRIGRRRFRGAFTTSSLEDFVSNVEDNAPATEGGLIWNDPDLYGLPEDARIPGLRKEE